MLRITVCHANSSSSNGLRELAQVWRLFKVILNNQVHLFHKTFLLPRGQSTVDLHEYQKMRPLLSVSNIHNYYPSCQFLSHTCKLPHCYKQFPPFLRFRKANNSTKAFKFRFWEKAKVTWIQDLQESR